MSSTCRLRCAFLPLLLTAGCAGGAPLLHPAHVLRPGFMSLGAGVTGQLAPSMVDVDAAAAGSARLSEELRDISLAPGMAPWVSGRVGLAGSNEAGLTYTGRSVRVDARHAVLFGDSALSIGVGASLVLPERPGDGVATRSVYGGGLDVPLLLGARTKSDLFAVWVGPRGGFELLGGHLAVAGGGPDAALDPRQDVDATHLYAGGVAGFRAGFRHVHAALEVDAGYHRASGTIGGEKAAIDGVSVTPSGALVVSF